MTVQIVEVLPPPKCVHGHDLRYERESVFCSMCLRHYPICDGDGCVSFAGHSGECTPTARVHTLTGGWR